jgi:hypothetical protein
VAISNESPNTNHDPLWDYGNGDNDKSDSVDLPFVARSIYVGVAGDVKINGPRNSSTAIVIPSLAAGIWHPMAVRRIWSTGSTATGIRYGR